MSISVLIPALNPPQKFAWLVQSLVESNEVSRVILVNDGSAHSFQSVFDAAASNTKVTVLQHAVNLGKGTALRAGMNCFLCSAARDEVLVTADADGQHLPEDILAVGLAAVSARGELILGSRSFDRDIPARSRFGNNMTRLVFRLLVGKSVSDTQTGLRAIPRTFIPMLLKLRAPGYEFELEMLILAARNHVPISSVPIQTVYLEGNQSSHFNPLLHSMRIYFVFARFVSSSMLTAITDYLVFSLMFPLTHSLAWGIVAGRTVAGTVNFSLNKRFVFHSKADWWRAAVRYAALVLALGSVAYILIYFLVQQAHMSPYLAKVAVEGLLVMGSFVLQRDVVFAIKPLTPDNENGED